MAAALASPDAILAQILTRCGAEGEHALGCSRSTEFEREKLGGLLMQLGAIRSAIADPMTPAGRKPSQLDWERRLAGWVAEAERDVRAAADKEARAVEIARVWKERAHAVLGLLDLGVPLAAVEDLMRSHREADAGAAAVAAREAAAEKVRRLEDDVRGIEAALATLEEITRASPACAATRELHGQVQDSLLRTVHHLGEARKEAALQ